MLERYHLTPDQVDELDADFVDVLIAKLRAENDLAEREAARAAKHKGRPGD